MHVFAFRERRGRSIRRDAISWSKLQTKLLLEKLGIPKKVKHCCRSVRLKGLLKHCDYCVAKRFFTKIFWFYPFCAKPVNHMWMDGNREVIGNFRLNATKWRNFLDRNCSFNATKVWPKFFFAKFWASVQKVLEDPVKSGPIRCTLCAFSRDKLSFGTEKFPGVCSVLCGVCKWVHSFVLHFVQNRHKNLKNLHDDSQFAILTEHGWDGAENAMAWSRELGTGSWFRAPGPLKNNSWFAVAVQRGVKKLALLVQNNLLCSASAWMVSQFDSAEWAHLGTWGVSQSCSLFARLSAHLRFHLSCVGSLDGCSSATDKSSADATRFGTLFWTTEVHCDQ